MTTFWTTTRSLLQNRCLGPTQRTCVPLIALILILFCSSCGSSSATNAGPPAESASAAAANPGPPVESGPAVAQASSSASGTVDVPEGQVAKVFSEPSLTSTVVTTLDSGTEVEVVCTAQGDTVSNASGATSSLWDETQYGYLPNVNVDTDTTQPVVPSCL
jgi:hypothetical protein